MLDHMSPAATTGSKGNRADADILALWVPGREQDIAQLFDVRG